MPDSLTMIDQYLSALPEGQRRALEGVRATVRSAIPEAEECISYGVPAFKLGRPIIGYGAASGHCAIYLMSGNTVEAFASELEGFSTSKGTIRFLPSNPPSDDLIRRLVAARLAENSRLKPGRNAGRERLKE